MGAIREEKKPVTKAQGGSRKPGPPTEIGLSGERAVGDREQADGAVKLAAPGDGGNQGDSQPHGHVASDIVGVIALDADDWGEAQGAAGIRQDFSQAAALCHGDEALGLQIPQPGFGLHGQSVAVGNC